MNDRFEIKNENHKLLFDSFDIIVIIDNCFRLHEMHFSKMNRTNEDSKSEANTHAIFFITNTKIK